MGFFGFLYLDFLRKKKKSFLYIDVLLHRDLLSKGAFSSLRQFLATEISIKMKKALFILKINKFSSLIFGQVDKQLH